MFCCNTILYSISARIATGYYYQMQNVFAILLLFHRLIITLVACPQNTTGKPSIY